MALVVLLRGVNVGGHRTFRPSTLAAALSHLDAVNIGAAGTFVIRRPVTEARLRAEVASRLPFDTDIVICRGSEMTALLTRHPLAALPVQPDVVRFVSVLSRRPRPAPAIPIRLPPTGSWLLQILALEGRYAYGVYRRHMKVVAYLGTLDKRFGVPVTTRNWNTISAIARVLDG